MVDKLSPEQRKKCMQANKSENTKPELIVRKYLFARGFHYRLHCKNLPGKPDLVLRKYSTVIFINGCFWHGHDGCQYYRLPVTNSEFWLKKIENNRARDLRDRERLIKLGWGVMVVWECQLRPKQRENTLQEIVYRLSTAYLQNKNVNRLVSYDATSENIDVAAEDTPEYGD